MNVSRRTYLQATALLAGLQQAGITTALTEPSTASSRIASLESGPVPNGSTRVPVESPHITLGHGMSYLYGMASGIPDLTREELATEVLKLHPDFWNQRYIVGMTGSVFYRSIPEGPRDGIDLAAALDLPSSLGFSWMPRDVPLDQRPAEREMSGYLYQLSRDEQWPGPDGRPAANPLHVSTARDLEGGVRTFFQAGDGTAGYSVSMYAPGPTNYHAANNEQAVLYGANATEMDGAIGPSNLLDGDFSVWAKRAFRTHLASLPQDRLTRLDITDPATFDIQRYTQRLHDDVVAGRKDHHDAVEDPVLFEFYLLEQQRIVEFYESYVARGRGAAEQVNSPLTALGNQGSDIASARSNASILLGKAFDLIEMEGPITLPGHESGRRRYDPAIRTTPHKRAAATSRVLDKPVVEHGFYGTGGREGTLDPTNRYPTLQTLNFAEVYANGSTRQFDLDGWNNLPPDRVALMWLDPDTGRVPDDLRPLADFIWMYKHDLQGTPRSDVAVVYSIPTMLAKARPFLDLRGETVTRMLDGMVRAARERHIPTDLLIFGHPDLWDDATTLNRLSDYETLVFPGVTSLTDAQHDAVTTFVSNGGTILYEGEFATRDAYYRPRENDLTRRDNVRDVRDAGRQASRGNIAPAGDALEATLDTPLVRVDAPSTLSCEVVMTDDGWRNVHLVNYDYNADTDAVSTVRNIRVALRDQQSEVRAVDVVAPGHTPTSLQVERDGAYVAVTVPATGVWSVLRFKTSQRTSDASADAASSAIETAIQHVEGLADTVRAIPKARAEAALYEAKLAAEAEQYDRAADRAEHARAQSKAANNLLRVGIDSGHGQSPNRTFSGLANFRAKYAAKYDVEFVEVTEYTPTQLAGLDGLLIGPALAFEGQTYTFDAAELDVLERFIAAGGRVGVVARPGVHESINDLTTQYGITVDPRELNTPAAGDSTVAKIEPAAYRTPITYQLTPWFLRGVCSLTNLSDDVAVQLQSSTNTIRKEDSDQAQRFPISAISQHDEGAIVVHCAEQLFIELQYTAEVQARNLIRFLGASNASVTEKMLNEPSQSTATDTDTTSTEPPETTPETSRQTTPGESQSSSESVTATSAPGFAVLAALSAIVLAIIRILNSHDD